MKRDPLWCTEFDSPEPDPPYDPKGMEPYEFSSPVNGGGPWAVINGDVVEVAGLPSHAAAWEWIDRHTDEGRADYDLYWRIRIAFA